MFAATGILAGVVSFALLLLATRAIEREHRLPRQRYVLPFTALALAQAFEAETAMLWETHIPVMHALVRGPVRATRLQAIHRRLTHSYPELFEGTDFPGWLRFLEEQELIECSTDHVSCTPAGREFFACIIAEAAAMSSAPAEEQFVGFY